MSKVFKLHVVPQNHSQFDFLFESETLTIGRSASADLVLQDQSVSRGHTRLFREGDKLFVEDLKSANGTLLNGHLVFKATETGPGDVLQLSSNVISIHLEHEQPFSSKLTHQKSGEQALFCDASELLDQKLQPETSKDPWSLGRYADRLRVLNELHGNLSRLIGRADMVSLVLDVSFAHLEPEEGAVFLKDEDGELNLQATRSRPEVGASFLYSQSLIKEVTEKGKAALVLDAQSDLRFEGSVSIINSGVRSLIAAPILDAEGIMGMIALNSRTGVRWFTEDDLAFLVSLASVAALKIRNLKATEELCELNRTLEQKVNDRTRELRAANEELLRNNEKLERTRDQLVRQEKMASLGTLTSGIAHEIKNPLNFVNNFSLLAKERVEELREDINEHKHELNVQFLTNLADHIQELTQTTELIHTHGSRANLIVQHMMNFADHKPASRQTFELNPLVEEVASIACRGDRDRSDGFAITRITELDPAVNQMEGVPRDFGRMLVNLINNALDTLEAKWDRLERAFQPELTVKTKAHDGGVLILVGDNGEGIEPDNLEKIFTPFFTTHTGPSGQIGLGLSITYDLIIKAGGDLEVESEFGTGSRFIIKFPGS